MEVECGGLESSKVDDCVGVGTCEAAEERVPTERAGAEKPILQLYQLPQEALVYPNLPRSISRSPIFDLTRARERARTHIKRVRVNPLPDARRPGPKSWEGARPGRRGRGQSQLGEGEGKGVGEGQ